MKILLVAPTHKYRSPKVELLSLSDFPAGIAYIAGTLKGAGHTVVGLNPNNATQYPSPFYMLTNMLSTVLVEHKPDLIGLAGICTDYAFLKDAIELCRRFAPTTPVVLGGGIVSNDREFVFNLLHPDYALVGEAEESLPQLCHVMEEQKPYANHNAYVYPFYDVVANLSWWQDGKPVHNPVCHDYPPLDDRPLPDYSIFGIDDMMDKYSMATRLLYRYSRQYPRPMTIVTARGCPFNCTFCVHRGGPKYRARSIPSVMEEIRVHYERYHFNVLLILDELFAVNKARLREFCEAIMDGKARYGWDFDWTFQTHASAALDLETLKLAKRAGCFFFSYGLESASPTVLESMNKRIKVPQIIEALHLAEEAGIGFGGNLIFGDPAETPSTIYESMEFYHQHCQKAFVFLDFLKPYPGNKLFDYCTAKGIIGDKAAYYANMEGGFVNMTGMPDQVWYSWANYFHLTEHSWFGFKATEATVIEEEGNNDLVAQDRNGTIYRIEANCPYCGGHIVYREILHKDNWEKMLGTGCTHCNRRIKVNLGVPQKGERPAVVREAVMV